MVTIGIILIIFLGLFLILRSQKLSQPRVCFSKKLFPSKRQQLYRQLRRMTYGDHAQIKRLVARAQANYPGKTDIWYLEKVIFDLERDRGR